MTRWGGGAIGAIVQNENVDLLVGFCYVNINQQV